MNKTEAREFENDIGSWDWIEEYEKHVPVVSAAELMEMTVEPREYVVQEILTHGLSMLGGAPKCGKSWFVLDLCVHVATGKPFLGFPVTKGTVWYISLEDTKEDLYWRLDTITDDEPKNLFFSTEDDELGTIDNGMAKHLNNFLDQHPDTKLIVIDTLQLARGCNKESNYVNDYADTQKFKQIADKRKVAILLVHHLRKMPDPDPVNMISGSTGLSGGVAGNFVMYSAPQQEVTRLFCKGRHTKPRILELRFDETACIWEKVFDNRETENKLPPELRVLLDFMQERIQFSGTNTALARVLTLRSGMEHSPKGLKQAMKRWEFVLRDCGITYRSRRSNGQRLVEINYAPLVIEVTEGTQVTQNIGVTENASLASLATL